MNDGTTRAVDEPAEDVARSDELTVSLTPRQLAFLALIAALILAVIRRLLGRRGSRGGA